MTVPKNKRTTSKLEFFYNVYKLNDKLTRILLRDFGVKKTSRDLKAFTYSAKMNNQDRKDFIGLCNKYGVNVEADYPLWLIEYYRDWILRILRELVNNITQANTIYPNSVNEFYLRREYQWKAIANCYQLKQAMQTAVRNLPVDVEKYMPFIEEIEAEIIALKNWKKSDNKILTKLQTNN